MSAPIMEAAALAGRLLLSAPFLHEGYAKLTAYSAAGYVYRGVRRAGKTSAAGDHRRGGLRRAHPGRVSRARRLALAGFCAVTAVVFHAKLGIRNELLHFEKDLAIAGDLLVLYAHGAGRWALDAFRPSALGAGIAEPRKN